MNSFLNKYNPYLFVVALLFTFAYLNYAEILFLRPQSIHQWRQSDNLSIALNYFQFDLSFWNPKTHHLLGNDGKTVAEFPIFYYLTAKFYCLFGNKEFILRLLHLSTFGLGLFYLRKTIFLFTKDNLFSSLVPFLFLSSTILIYYANNFISDAPALGLVMMSWYFFSKYYQEEKLKKLFIGIVIITLAGLIKTTSFITLIIFGLILLLEFRKRNLIHILMLAIPFVITFLWLIFAKNYNESNENIYFLLKVKPIWLYSLEQNSSVWNRLISDWGWRNDIFPDYILYLVLISIIGVFFINVKAILKIAIATSLFLCIFFFLLMYPQFYHHDYYYIHIIPFLMMPLIILVWNAGVRFNSKLVPSILIFWFSIYVIIQSKERLADRYKMESEFTPFYNISEKLKKLGFMKKTKVISISDNTYCVSLYLMNQQGWTNLNIKKDVERQYIIDTKHKEWNTKKYITSEFESRIKRGAEYLFINNKDENISFIPSKYLKNMIFENSELKIFKIKE